jgi:hypothetical protein
MALQMTTAGSTQIFGSQSLIGFRHNSVLTTSAQKIRDACLGSSKSLGSIKTETTSTEQQEIFSARVGLHSTARLYLNNSQSVNL